MKYEPLKAWLTQQATGTAEITLRFADIEKMIGTMLPKSASTYREWWANQGYGTQARCWQSAGFSVDAVDLGRRIVRFRRVESVRTGSTLVPNRSQPRVETQVSKAICKNEMLVEAGFISIGSWRQIDGRIQLDGDIPTKPGVYAYVVDGSVCYVGSATVGLKKRLYFYEKPGPTQRTNIRINALIANLLADGKNVNVIAAFPEDFVWNQLPVCAVTGLEAGLVKKLSPPWNKHGVARKVVGCTEEP